MRRAITLFCWLIPATVQAQDVTLLDEGGTVRARAPNLAMELLDPTARTSFHLATRFTFSDADETFSESSLSTFEASAVVRIIEGVGISFGLPFALDAPVPGNDQFFIGNIYAGVVGGGVLHFGTPGDAGGPTLGIGGGFAFYAPSARSFEDTGTEAERMALIRNTRSYEQELYLERTAAFRFRAHVDFAISIVTTEVELGISPAVTTQDSADFLMLFFWGARVAVRPIDELEPFVEIGSSLQVVGDPLHGNELDTPVRLTVGLRGHFGIDPALFVSIDLAEGGVLFGVDLAAAFRTEARSVSDRESLDDITP